jgi:outer membrane protein assembly factor BamB
VIACALAGSTALAGCLDDDPSRSLPAMPRGTWGQFAHDAANTGAAEVAVPDRGTLAWESGDAWEIPPLVAGDTVFSVATQIDALDAQTGETRWSVDLDAETGDATAPAVTAEAVILGVAGRVVAVERDSGDLLWETPREGAAAGPVTVDPAGELALVPFERRGRDDLVALEVGTGTIAWTVQMRFGLDTVPPAVFEGRVYAAGRRQDDTEVLRAYDLTDGTRTWERELIAETPPAVTSNGVFISDEGTLRRVSHSGDESRRLLDLDRVDRVSRRIQAVAVAGETAFVLSPAGLFAVSVTDGSQQWQTEVEPLADGICVGQESVVVSVRSDEFDTMWPCVAAFDRADGSTRWYYSVGKSFDPTLGQTAIADGAVYFLSNTVDGIAALGDLAPKG